MGKQEAMVKAQKYVVARFGTLVGHEAREMYKRYYLYYRSPNHALPTWK